MKSRSFLSGTLDSERNNWLLLGSILLMGIILRFYGLGEQNYWYDELITLRVAEGSYSSIITGPRPPVYLALFKLWTSLFGTSEIATRFLSILFGTVSIVLVFAVGRLLFGNYVGMLSAFFMVVSKFQIYYAQEIRYYSLFEMMTLISFYLYLKLLKSASWIYSVAYVLSSVILYYTHDFGILILAVQITYLLVKFKKQRAALLRWVISLAAIIILISPRFLDAFRNKAISEEGPNWIGAPSLLSPVATSYNFLGLSLNVHGTVYGLAAAVLFVAGTIIYLAATGRGRLKVSHMESYKNKKKDGIGNGEATLVILWFLLPISAALVMSKVSKPMYLDRYLICTAPALYILAALFIYRLRNIVPTALFLICYVILITPGLYGYYSKPARDDWREIGSFVRQNDPSSSPVVIISYYSITAFDWYNDGEYVYCALPEQRITLNELFRLCKVDNLDHFWVILNDRQSDGNYPPFYDSHSSRFKIENEGQFIISNTQSVKLFSFRKSPR